MIRTTIRAIALAAVSTFLVSSLSAGLMKYKEWGTSPQAYFMTQAERTQWNAITNDDDAEKFVQNFIASRGPGFVGTVAERAAMADKYLTSGKTPGSQTLRGKVVVLLGPPAQMDMSTRKDAGKRDNPVVSGVMSNINPSGGGAGRDDGGSNAVTAGIPGAVTNMYTMIYHGDSAPALKRSEFSFTIDIDAASGKDRLHDTKASNALFEEIAQASIVKK
jgi:GWxTD domain-containing protein